MPDLTLYIQATTFNPQLFIPAVEQVIGTCGQILYRIEPNPEFFNLDPVTSSVGMNLGIVSPPPPGSYSHTLTAYYADFPSITATTTFTLNWLDICNEPPIGNFMIQPVTYTIDTPAVT